MYTYNIDSTNSDLQLLESFYSSIGEEKEPIKFDGQVIGYRSDDLDSEYIKQIYNNSGFNTVSAKKLEKVVKNRKLIPAYSSLTWLGDISDTFLKIFRSLSGMLIGFYDGKRILIFITNLRAFDGSISDKELYTITVHEHQHKFAGERSNYASDSKVKTILKDWYNQFIDLYFTSALTPKARAILLKFWFNIKGEYTTQIAKHIESRINLFDEITKSFSSTENDVNNIRMKALNQYVRDMYYGDFPYNMTPFEIAIKTYNKLGVRANTWAFQEFIIASEVLAVTSGSNREVGNYMINKFL